MDVLRRIRAERSKLRVVLLTAAIDDSSLLEAKSLKVQGMVLKNSDPAYLLDCLDRVRHGRTWIDPELRERAKQLAKTLSPAARRRRWLHASGSSSDSCARACATARSPSSLA